MLFFRRIGIGLLYILFFGGFERSGLKYFFGVGLIFLDNGCFSMEEVDMKFFFKERLIGVVFFFIVFCFSIIVNIFFTNFFVDVFLGGRGVFV